MQDFIQSQRYHLKTQPMMLIFHSTQLVKQVYPISSLNRIYRVILIRVTIKLIFLIFLTNKIRSSSMEIGISLADLAIILMRCNTSMMMLIFIPVTKHNYWTRRTNNHLILIITYKHLKILLNHTQTIKWTT